jgi:hypothetical protein
MMLSERGAAIVCVAEGDTSMVPHLRGGDAVLAVPLTSTPRGGDLVLYRQQDYWVVHRCLGPVVSKDGGAGLRTRGDGRNALDPLLALEDVLARIAGLRRGGVWHSLDGRAARAYARLMVWHDLAWAAAGIAVGRVGLSGVVAALDLTVLRLLVPVAFPPCHRRIAGPSVPGPDGPV